MQCLEIVNKTKRGMFERSEAAFKEFVRIAERTGPNLGSDDEALRAWNGR